MPPPVTDATVRAEHARVRRLARETADVVYVGSRTGQFAVRFSRPRDGVRQVALTRVDADDGLDAGFDDAEFDADAELDTDTKLDTDTELDTDTKLDTDTELDTDGGLDADGALDASQSFYHCVVRTTGDADDARRVVFHHPFPALEWLNETIPAFDLLEFEYVNGGGDGKGDESDEAAFT